MIFSPFKNNPGGIGIFAFLAVMISAYETAQGGLSVSASPVSEGSDPGAPMEAVFSLTLSPLAETDTFWEYRTASDTAREGEDYLPVRGVVTIPAGQSGITVRVPLIADSIKEDPETFSLLVWPQGTAPVPGFTEIPKPASPAGFMWTNGSTGVSNGTWFSYRETGMISNGSWTAGNLGNLAISGSSLGAISGYGVSWLEPIYNGTTFRSILHVGVAEPSRENFAPWQPYTQVPLGEGNSGNSAMSGDLLACNHGGYIHLLQLFHHHQPRPVASFDIGANPIAFDRIVGFNGHRMALSYYSEAASEIRIFECTDDSRVNWKLRTIIPDASVPAALEGDILVARQASGGFAAPPRIFHKDQGGLNQWGHCSTISAPTPASLSTFAPVALKGGLLLIGDAGNTNVSLPGSSGRILVFSNGATPSEWSYCGSISSPSSVPGDAFGASLAQGGRDLLTFSFGAQNKAWGGSFPGATVTIQNDDLPVIHASAQVGFEPAGNSPSVLKGLMTLSHEAETPVVVSWTTTDGSAQSGTDFTAVTGQTVIPAGSLSSPFEISILPDNEWESDETVGFRTLSVSGAVSKPSQEFFTIRDTDRPSAYIQAAAPNAFEGTPFVSAQVKCLASNGPVSITAAGILPILGESGKTAADYGLATPGVDWPGLPQLLAFSSAGTLPLPLPVNNDNTLDYHRNASIAFTLPPAVSSASYSPRFIDGVAQSSPEIPYSEPSTDGEWTIAKTTEAGQTALMLYHRPAASGNWSKAGPVPASLIGRTSWTGVRVIARGGRLACYDSDAGQAWMVRLDSGAVPFWQWEADIPDVPRSAYYQDSMDFDGDTLAIHSLLIDRGANDWKNRQWIESPSLTSLFGPLVRLHRGLLFFYTWRANEPIVVRVAARSGPPNQPWSFIQSIPVDLGTPAGIVLRRILPYKDILALGISNNGASQTQIFRRNDAGEWLLEQVLPVFATALSDGMLFSTTLLFAETGPSAAKWQSLGAVPFAEAFDSIDFTEGLVVTASSFPQRLKIWEPGLSVTIVDKESINISLTGSSLVEPAGKEALRLINVNVDFPVPVDIAVPFRTGTGGTAMAGLDFRPVQGQVIIPAGSGTAQFALPLLPDTLQEGTETVEISLSAPSYGVIQPASQSKLYNLTDNPLAGPLAPAPVFFPEPEAGSKTHLVLFSMAAPSSGPLTVRYSTVARSASSGDFTVVTDGSVILPAGATSIPIPVTILADQETEAVESLEINISHLGTLALSQTLTATVFIDDFPAGGTVPDNFAAIQNNTLEAAASRNVLTNDGAGKAAAFMDRPANHGTANLLENGTFEYVPASNFIGTDHFSYFAGSVDSFCLAGQLSWKWLSLPNGANPAGTVPDFQNNWMLPSFDDTTWKPGSGWIGFGQFGPGSGLPPDTDIGQPPSGSRYTAYLRTSFTVPALPPAGVALSFSCDDAAIFYLNGQPLGRYAKAPAGTFATASDTHLLLAPTAHDVWEETEIRELSIPSAQLQQGSNTLAVSIHNNSNNSSDLGFKLHRLTSGGVSRPAHATLTVTDSLQPPVLSPDTYTIAGTNVPVSSYLIGGSLYSNDGLHFPDGSAYDPILETETGGTPVGPVILDPGTGHFSLTPPRGFYGTTGFTYRVRDKDGWSQPVPVTINIAPSRPWDVWRRSRISNDWQSPLAAPGADLDGDGLPNALEYLLGLDPQSPEFDAPLGFRWNGNSWESVFWLKTTQRTEFFLQLEASASLLAPQWDEIANIPPTGYFQFERVKAPAILAAESSGAFTKYTITWPAGGENSRFVRLKALQVPNVMDP